MKIRLNILTGLLVVLCATTVAQASIIFSLVDTVQNEAEEETPALTTVEGRQRWEYGVDSIADLEWSSKGQQLGDDGWEIISARRARGDNDEMLYEVMVRRPTE